MASEQNSASTLSDTTPRANLWQRMLTLVIVVAMLAGMVLALSSCKSCEGQKPPQETINVQDTQVPVFFTKSKGTRSVTESVVRNIPKDYTKPHVQFAVEALLEGPTEDERRAGFFSEVPKGTKLLSIEEANNTVTVNLSEDFASGGGSNSVIQRMAEVQNTVIAASKTDGKTPLKVNVKVQNRQIETLGGEGLEVPTQPEQPIQ